MFTIMFLILSIVLLSFVPRNNANETTVHDGSQPAQAQSVDAQPVTTTEKDEYETVITPQCDAVPGKLVVTGDIVKFSEIVKPDGTFDNHCGNNSNVTTLYIFAKYKVFIDQNIRARGFDMFILAPVWEVVTMSFIYLTGLDGERLPTPKPIGVGWDGVNGRPGNPGNPGGNFFGVGESFINGQYLTVDVSGGDGGVGQDGGKGGPGTDGVYALKSNLSLTCSRSACDESGKQLIALADSAGEYSNFKCKEEYNYITYDMFFLPPVSASVRECSYYIYGTDGTVAGAGGDGGVGGRGGHPGEVYLLELFEPSGISKVNNSGNPGMDGKGAQGGDCAYAGWDVSFKKNETYSNESPHISGTPVVKYVESQRLVCLKKSSGVDGGNSRFVKEPVQNELVGFRKLYNAMTEFTMFFKASL